MLAKTKEWEHCATVLHHAPDGTFDHWLGDQLLAADAEQALALLVDIIVDDPPTSHEYSVAAHMICHLSGAEQ
jgi:hypothetical protein